MTIVCTGSIAYDYLMTFPGYFKDHILQERLDCISLSFLVDSMVRQRGGTAPNIAYTLALLGDRPLIFGTVGEDFEDYRAWLESKQVDTAFARLVPGVFTASFFCNTDRSNAQIASFYPGAMAFASQLSLAELTKYRVDLVVISPNDPQAMDCYVRECRQMGLPYLYDPSQQVVRLSGEELRRGVEGAYSLFCNEYEFELLQKHTGLSATDMRSLVKILVVTLGEKGAIIFADGKEVTVPVVPATEILDPTGVGDAFRGGFLRGWQLGLDWSICGRMGALAATYVLEQRGPQSHTYTLPDFVARYRQHFDDRGVLDILIH
ncbi:MAG TPA: carbohydrate kinase family protein [Anaerolineaceae bacterium]|jgi:adenosine kinase|nr:carbohydrate kinase family protein [Anaerolineaceae bacterium]